MCIDYENETRSFFSRNGRHSNYEKTLRTEKFFRNLIKSNRNPIVYTLFRLICNQTDVRLVQEFGSEGLRGALNSASIIPRVPQTKSLHSFRNIEIEGETHQQTICVMNYAQRNPFLFLPIFFPGFSSIFFL